MAYKIVIKEEAREDIQTVYDHYETARQGPGEEFPGVLLEKFDHLEDSPHYYGFIDDQAIIRDVKIDRFPYVVIFEIIDDTVIVYAIHCTYRHPKRRLRN